ncbi:MAG: AAA family ATPase [Gemmatimonadales bacterium]
MLITVSRQYGAGGSLVARTVADALGWTVVDNELIDQVARRAGLSPDEVADREERVPSFVERLARTLVAQPVEVMVPATPLTELDEAGLVRLTEVVVSEIAAQGRVVLVGRAAVAVLARVPEAMHVKLVAPVPARVQVVMNRMTLDRKEAEKAVHDVDARRLRYHQEYYGRDWEDPAGYHMVLNTAALGFDGAAELIVKRAERLGWKD